jgi:catechol 2,3-dioxygenase-like lactoylglutathione lyase family enzyme
MRLAQQWRYHDSVMKVVYMHQPVGNQDNALDFYTRVLGFEKRADNPAPDGSRFLSVAANGQDFQLVLGPHRRALPLKAFGTFSGPFTSGSSKGAPLALFDAAI